MKGKDELAAWAKNRKTTGLFVKPDSSVQEAYRAVVDYVYNNYDQANSRVFLDYADPWLIAHALSTSGIAVTHEGLVGSNSRQVKIPNVCAHFGVGWASIFEVTRKLGLKLTVAAEG